MHINTKVVGSNTVHGDVYPIQHYVIKFVSDLRQIGGFLRFPPPTNLTAKRLVFHMKPKSRKNDYNIEDIRYISSSYSSIPVFR